VLDLFAQKKDACGKEMVNGRFPSKKYHQGHTPFPNAQQGK